MAVAACELDLRLTSKPRNLKEKRRIVLSLKDRLKRGHNVSVSEVDGMDLWQRCVLGLACVAATRKQARQTLEAAAAEIENTGGIEIINRIFEEI